MAAMRASMEVMDTWLKYIKIICRSAAEQIRQEKNSIGRIIKWTPGKTTAEKPPILILKE